MWFPTCPYGEKWLIWCRERQKAVSLKVGPQPMLTILRLHKRLSLLIILWDGSCQVCRLVLEGNLAMATWLQAIKGQNWRGILSILFSTEAADLRELPM